jgi:hypothetical protein
MSESNDDVHVWMDASYLHEDYKCIASLVTLSMRSLRSRWMSYVSFFTYVTFTLSAMIVSSSVRSLCFFFAAFLTARRAFFTAEYSPNNCGYTLPQNEFSMR